MDKCKYCWKSPKYSVYVPGVFGDKTYYVCKDHLNKANLIKLKNTKQNQYIVVERIKRR